MHLQIWWCPASNVFCYILHPGKSSYLASLLYQLEGLFFSWWGSFKVDSLAREFKNSHFLVTNNLGFISERYVTSAVKTKHRQMPPPPPPIALYTHVGVECSFMIFKLKISLPSYENSSLPSATFRYLPFYLPFAHFGLITFRSLPSIFECSVCLFRGYLKQI